MKEKGEEDEGGGEGKKEGALPVIPRTRRWEKGHRMALSSGSSVSEDVWTLIKMCRASGAVSFFFRSLVLSLFLHSLVLPFPPSRCSFLHDAYMRAIARKKNRDF